MQQQTNFFTPTQKHLIQLHGFPNITDIIYVKPLYSVRSLVVYPSLRPDSVAIPLFHSAEGQRYLSPQYYLLFATYHMYDRLFIYVKHTNSYVPSRIPVPTTGLCFNLLYSLLLNTDLILLFSFLYISVPCIFIIALRIKYAPCVYNSSLSNSSTSVS